MTIQQVLSIRAKDLFKILVVGYSGIYIPVSIISSLLALFEAVPVTFNDENYMGVVGFSIGIITTPIFILVMTIATWIFLAIGMKLARVGYRVFAGNND